MKKQLAFCLVLFLLLLCNKAFAIKVIYDDTHGQTAENADWVTDGAYSEMADMLKAEGFEIDDLSAKAKDGLFTSDLLQNYEAIILAEPNNPYSEEEMKLFVNFVKNGGGLFIIGDHDHSDRNRNGWDSVRIFNSFTPNFGFKIQKDGPFRRTVFCKLFVLINQTFFLLRNINRLEKRKNFGLSRVVTRGNRRELHLQPKLQTSLHRQVQLHCASRHNFTSPPRRKKLRLCLSGKVSSIIFQSSFPVIPNSRSIPRGIWLKSSRRRCRSRRCRRAGRLRGPCRRHRTSADCTCRPCPCRRECWTWMSACLRRRCPSATSPSLLSPRQSCCRGLSSPHRSKRRSAYSRPPVAAHTGSGCCTRS